LGPAKGLPSMEIKRASANLTIEKAAGNSGTFVLTSPTPDRDQDTITENAIKNAVKKLKRLMCLWQHKQDQPIGSWENLRMDGKRLLGDLKLASTNLGLMVRQLLEEDVPLAASIGFMGKGGWNDIGGIDFEEIELLECSVVSVPSNRDAVRIAKSFGVDVAPLGGTGIILGPGIVSEPSAASIEAIRNAKRAIARVNLSRIRS
ncbi:MAG: HK97 family phage prohead protease, partial [Chitinophagaceae bacterium]